ncbi:hypothetical protein ACLB1O_04530 [Escherichia coli]
MLISQLTVVVVMLSIAWRVIVSSTLRSRLLGLTRRWFRSGLSARRALWTLRR